MQRDATNDVPRSRPQRPQIDAPAAMLWAAAFILLGLIISAAGQREPLDPQAMADVSEVGDITVVTSRAGVNWDIMALLDRRAELLYIYGVEGTRNVELYQVLELDEAFIQASR